MPPSPEIPCLNSDVLPQSPLDDVRDALMGRRGEEQKRIATHGLAWLTLMLAKNHDYGGAVWKPPTLRPHLDAGDAILVRMGDKIDRLKTLLKAGVEPQVAESVDDTIRDLGAYCLLYLARPKE